MKFDPVLLLLVYSITNLACAGVIYLLWRSSQPRANGIGFWVANLTLQFFATLLLATRGIAPDFVAMVMGSSLATIGTFLQLIGLGRYLNRPVAMWPNVALITVFVLVHCYFALIDSNPVGRNTNVTLTLSILCGQSAWLLLRPSSSPRINGHLLAGGVMVAFTIFNLGRMLFEWSTAAGPARPDNQQVVGLSVLVYQTITLLWTFGLVLLVNRRLSLIMKGDLLERQRLLAEVESTRSRLERAEVRSGFGHWELDFRTNEFTASPGALAIYEIGPGKVHRSTTLEYALPQDKTILEQAFQSVITKGTPYNVIYRIQAPQSGKIKYLHAMGELDVDRQKAFGVLQDITPQKEIESALRQSEFLGDQALELARAGPWCIDFAEGDSHYISSPRTVEIFGDPPSANLRYDILNHWYTQIEAADPAAAQATYANFREALEGARPRYDAVHPYRRPADGAIIWVHVIGQVTRNAEGEPTYVYGVVMDITASVQSQRELEQARDAAEVANRAKSSFLANMSHEIRTPLNAINGMAHMMRQSGLAPLQLQRLEKLEGASRHLMQIINDILDLSKIEAGKLELEQRRFHLDDVVENTLVMLSDRARAKKLDFRFTVDLQHHWYVGDVTRIQQALINYGSNAIKFTDQGSVHIHVHSHSDDEQRSRLCFEVRDTGIGISEDQGQRMFNAFEQADNSTTRKFGGTGLGLSITRQIAALMKGEVGYSSEPGKGSTFWFTAELEKAPAPTNEAPQASDFQPHDLLRRNHAGTRVLVADDDPLNLEIAAYLLEEVGFVVDQAENGQQAVDLAAESDYRIVFLDIHMPVMDGLEAAVKIRQLSGYANKPLFAMTGGAFTQDQRRCADAGMDYFVSKPVSHEVLYRAVLSALEST